MLARLLWRGLASLCLGLAALGVLLPGLPTTPFLLVAAWAGSRGWPALEARLLAHPHYGPMVQDWRQHRAVPRRAKWAATLLMLASAIMIQFSPVPSPVKWLLPAFLLCVALWLWRRPEAQR